jgi:hypothetical protein
MVLHTIGFVTGYSSKSWMIEKGSNSFLFEEIIKVNDQIIVIKKVRYFEGSLY